MAWKNCGCYYNHQFVSLAGKLFCILIVYDCFFKNSLLISVTCIKLNYLNLGEMCLSHALCFGTVFRYPRKMWTAFTLSVLRVLCTTQEEKSVTIPYPLDWHLPFPSQHWDQLQMTLQLTNKAPIKCKRKVSKHILTRETKGKPFLQLLAGCWK